MRPSARPGGSEDLGVALDWTRLVALLDEASCTPQPSPCRVTSARSVPTRNRTENLLIKSLARGVSVRQRAPGPANSRHSRSDPTSKGLATKAFPERSHILSHTRSEVLHDLRRLRLERKERL
jgi:hypothetical protein